MINHISSVPSESGEFGATMMGLLIKLNDNTPKDREVSASNYLKHHFLKSQLPKVEYDAWMKANYKEDIHGDFIIQRHF
jgi:hypothetical protein